ncbi:hypothetical protein AB0O08_15880 [Streptomyces anulatus]|uniref:TRADD-N-associated membrane domain-containing protein n=1 Tax=Streptomyces anulatus TaxID=1892 RepID=UPI003427A3FC
MGVVLMETVFEDRLPEGMPEPFTLIPVVALLVTMAASAAGIGFSAGESEAVGESRQRLTRAEGALTDAIRREYANVDVVGGGTLLDHHDAQSSGDPELNPDRSQPAVGELGRRGALGLPELWEATHARLDLYHQIATNQATKSFNNAQRAMVAGFVLLVIFAGIAIWASTTVGAIVAGGLGAVSAALAGYIAKTFVRSQEAAATHLRSYFDQPLELSRYLAAERLVADGDLSQEQRGEILTALVQAMVAGPQPPPPPQSVVVASVPGQQGA